MDSKSFLGTGAAFPLSVDPRTGRLETVSLEEDIRQAIGITLRTNEGERVMNPEFGSRIMDYVFESDTQSFSTLAAQEVQRALIRWEPRIDDVEVFVRVEPGSREQAIVEISYRVRSTNNYFNLVYPFYLLEGVDA